ncbi:MAG TPA: hypothetical protein VHG72_01760 [Polyangia bacterium]|nr:hypothetical protein [Polyangia bacterium]
MRGSVAVARLSPVDRAADRQAAQATSLTLSAFPSGWSSSPIDDSTDDDVFDAGVSADREAAWREVPPPVLNSRADNFVDLATLVDVTKPDGRPGRTHLYADHPAERVCIIRRRFVTEESA